jgi:hypothetical protein
MSTPDTTANSLSSRDDFSFGDASDPVDVPNKSEQLGFLGFLRMNPNTTCMAIALLFLVTN